MAPDVIAATIKPSPTATKVAAWRCRHADVDLDRAPAVSRAPRLGAAPVVVVFVIPDKHCGGFAPGDVPH